MPDSGYLSAADIAAMREAKALARSMNCRAASANSPGVVEANAKWHEISEEVFSAQECLSDLLHSIHARFNNRLDSEEAARRVRDCLAEVRHYLLHRLELLDEADALDDIAEKELEVTSASLQSGAKRGRA